MPHRRTRHRSLSGRPREDGAALVEFAFVAMPLLLILFGMIEFGWTFFQLNDVRHGAREGIRLVAVNADPSPASASPSDRGDRIAQAACERMDRRKDVTITITLADIDSNGKLEVGDDATLTASKQLEQITGMFNSVLSGVTLDETITTRLEQDPHSTLQDGVSWQCVS